MNVTHVTFASAGNDSDSELDSESDEWARTADYVDGCDSDTGSDSEADDSSSAMPYDNDCEPAYSAPPPTTQHLQASEALDTEIPRTCVMGSLLAPLWRG